MSGIDALTSATRYMRLACWNPRIVLATNAPDTTPVVMSCALRDSVALEIQEDMLAQIYTIEEKFHPAYESEAIYVQ
jgi:hypothetical protein